MSSNLKNRQHFSARTRCRGGKDVFDLNHRDLNKEIVVIEHLQITSFCVKEQLPKREIVNKNAFEPGQTKNKIFKNHITLLCTCAAARAASQRLRGEVDNLITQCANEMWSHWSNTNMSFQQRITEATHQLFKPVHTKKS